MENCQNVILSRRCVFTVLASLTLGLFAAAMPLVAAAIKIEILDPNLGLDWLRPTDAEEAIADFLRCFGWPF